MKRVLPVLMLVLLASAALVATAAASALEWGVKAGVSSATLNGDIRDQLDPKSSTSLTGGLSLALPFGNLVAIEADGLYVRKGANIPEPGTDDELRLAYIEVPVLARVTIPAGGLPFKPFVVAGPSFAYNVDAKLTPGNPSTPEQDLSDKIHKLDTGVSVGAGLRASLASFGLTLEARYTPSLTDVQKDNSTLIPSRNSVFSVLAGVVF
jgi:hypothetical protein